MKRVMLLCTAMLAVIIAPLGVFAQQMGYKQTNLVANTAGVANKTDPRLSNSWGIAFFSGSPFWIADNNSGFSTIYDAQGNTALAPVAIPSANNPCNPACPTGIVANTTPDFGGGAFLFDTEDGILASWNGAGNATKVFDNSASGAVYKGLALLKNSSGNFLLAANFRSAKIDVYDRNFNLTALAGTFTTPNLPAGFAPHGVHVINNNVYVAYAMQDAAKHDPVPGAGSGVIGVFDLNGTFVKILASGGTLNAPWGVVMSPSTFGAFSNALLVGNFGDGTINALAPATGMFLGQLNDSSNRVIVNAGLWDMVFGEGGTGDPNTLYFTAGGANQTQGLFATLVPAPAVTTADFSLMLSSPTLTVNRGSSAQLMVSSSASGGFNSPISLSCSSMQAGVSCSFSPATITPGSSTATSSLTVSVGSNFSIARLAWPTMSLGLLGFAAIGVNRKRLVGTAKRRLWILGLFVVTAALLVAMGCGGSNRSMMMNSSNAMVTVTGTAGAVSHSTVLTVMVQ